MTITSNYQLINQKFNQLRTLLVSKLHNCYVEKEITNSFTELIEAVNDIKAVETINTNNVKPTNMPEIDKTNLSTFNITLYTRIRYYMKLLGYFLILKGVPRYEVNAQTDLKGLIELIDMIDIIKPSILTIGQVNEIQYFGTNINIPYTLKDIDGQDIKEGDITIQDSDGIIYDSIEVGESIVIAPMDISPKINDEYQYQTFIITYNGTEKYTESDSQIIRVKILPAQIHLILNITNMSSISRYFNSNNIGYKSDEWTISIVALNHQNQPLVNIPFDLSIDNVNILEDEETNEDGSYILNHYVISETGNHTINCVTNYPDTDKISNASVNHELTIKYEILRQNINDYTDYTGKNNYQYEIELIDEDSGQRTNQYDNNSIKIFLYEEYSDNDGVQIGIANINNGKAIYNFNSLNAGNKVMTWLFEYDNFSTQITTNLHILSNFILPEKQIYFLNDTPTIIYAPEGVISANNTITGTLNCSRTIYEDRIIGYDQKMIFTGYLTETTQILIGYETEYNEITGEDEYILDNNGERIPIYDIEENEVLGDNGEPIQLYEIQDIPIIVTDEYIDETTEYLTLITNENGELDLSNYKNIGNYTLTLQSGNNLNEECLFKYELKKPFDIELINYNKKSIAQYKVTLYDEEDNYILTMTNNGNNINPNLYNIYTATTYLNDNNEEEYYTYKTMIVDIPISNSLLGENQLSLTVNGYTESVSFKFVGQLFNLLTNSVNLGDDTMMIQCNDDAITSIDIESSNIEINNITYENNIFTVNAIFNQAGNISFNVTDDSLSTETFSIQVNKKNLEPYIEYLIFVKNPQESLTNNNFAFVDADKLSTIFSIDTEIYSDLQIIYRITQGNWILTNQSFIYHKNTEDNNFTLNVPNLAPGQYQLEFIFAGNNNYYAFNKISNFVVQKPHPTHEVIEKYTVFKNNQFFIYNPKFTQNEQSSVISGNHQILYNEQQDGIWTSIGYYLSDGWKNTGLWECDFDISADNLRYISIHILAALEPTIEKLIGGFEGPIATNPPGHYTRDNNDTLSVLNGNIFDAPSVSWCHINIKKTSPTTLIVTKTGDNVNNGSVTYEWQELSNYPKVTIGSEGNENGDGLYLNKIKIKNLIVRGVY